MNKTRVGRRRVEEIKKNKWRSGQKGVVIDARMVWQEAQRLPCSPSGGAHLREDKVVLLFACVYSSKFTKPTGKHMPE